MLNRLNILRRLRAWKGNIETSVTTLTQQLADTAARSEAGDQRLAAQLAETAARSEAGDQGLLQEMVDIEARAEAAEQRGLAQATASEARFAQLLAQTQVHQTMMMGFQSLLDRHHTALDALSANFANLTHEAAKREAATNVKIDQQLQLILSMQSVLDKHNGSIAELAVLMPDVGRSLTHEAATREAATNVRIDQQLQLILSMQSVLDKHNGSIAELAVLMPDVGRSLTHEAATRESATDVKIDQQLRLILGIQSMLDRHNESIAELAVLIPDVGRSLTHEAATREAATNVKIDQQLQLILGMQSMLDKHNELIAELGALMPDVQSLLAKHNATIAQISVGLPDAEALLARHDAVIAEFADALPPREEGSVHDRLLSLERTSGDLVSEGVVLLRLAMRSIGRAGALVSAADHVYLTERKNVALIVASYSPKPAFRRGDFRSILKRIEAGEIETGYVTEDLPREGLGQLHPAGDVIELLRAMPVHAAQLFDRAGETDAAPSPQAFYERALRLCAANPHLVDTVWAEFKEAFGDKLPPFDQPGRLPDLAPARPRRRSALFLHNNYYHYNQLSAALRKRGWDTLTVSLEAPDSASRQFYFGEDLNLYDPDPQVTRENARQFFQTVPERFESLHFYGRGRATFFAELEQSIPGGSLLPWDFLELRRHRVIIGHMPSGCLEGARQSDIRRVTKGLCSACIWEKQSEVCSDAHADSWTQRLEAVCDWVGLEGDWAVGARAGTKYVRGPVIATLDPDTWRPCLEIPEELKLDRQPGEIIIYHAVGNDALRRRAGRDIKGTSAILTAIDTLKAEGHPVRLAFFSKVPSTRMRFIQSQADIVVDQLLYGRYGANARECMMLGLPTVGYLNPLQEDRDAPDRAIDACPIVQADTSTITDVLRGLVRDPEARRAAGEAGRAFMLDWHAGPVCAERYERVIDRIRAGLAPDSPELYPSVNSASEPINGSAGADPATVRIANGPRGKLSAHRASQD